jgi:predicted dehydrogenase
MIKAAIVGLGTWGQNLVKCVQGKSSDIQFVAGATRTPAKAADFAALHNISMRDSFEALLADPAIDAVVLATPHSIHTEQIVAAANAGKHVFCQKPLSLTLEENRLARAAAEKYPKLQFFIGTQQRSQKDQFLRAVNMVHKGLLGDIQKVTVGINGAPTGGPFEVAEVPKQLDWEMWQGQAQLVPYREKRCHYEFRWWYEYFRLLRYHIIQLF